MDSREGRSRSTSPANSFSNEATSREASPHHPRRREEGYYAWMVLFFLVFVLVFFGGNLGSICTGLDTTTSLKNETWTCNIGLVEAVQHYNNTVRTLHAHINHVSDLQVKWGLVTNATLTTNFDHTHELVHNSDVLMSVLGHFNISVSELRYAVVSLELLAVDAQIEIPQLRLDIHDTIDQYLTRRPTIVQLNATVMNLEMLYGSTMYLQSLLEGAAKDLRLLKDVLVARGAEGQVQDGVGGRSKLW
ncbi:hypothetical protein BKA80DRAFT_308839 [Phyllosticta citrichinensis]